MDGAHFRVDHFARQLSSPFPLLAAVGAKTRKIEIATAVIDMRYENPYYMAGNADAADLISGGPLQLAKGLWEFRPASATSTSSSTMLRGTLSTQVARRLVLLD